jgi:NAD+ synthase (glutamine-hydrolysing)
MSIISVIQGNFSVGDFSKNQKNIISLYKKNSDADIVIFPEGAITGYPAEDLLLSQNFIKNSLLHQENIIAITTKATIIFGGLSYENNKLYNVAIIAREGKILHVIKKTNLANYGVFDEKRYFSQSKNLSVVNINNKNYLILICADLWDRDLLEKTAKLKFDHAIIINASPYNKGKINERINLVSNLCKKYKISASYVNMVATQDNLIFDGSSFILNQEAKLVKLLKFCQEDGYKFNTNKLEISSKYQLNENSNIYNALCFSLKEYLSKNKAKSVLIGLSGGVDSALIAVIACDAIGAENVHLVMMPSKFTSKASHEDANKLIKKLGCKNIYYFDIEDINSLFLQNLSSQFKDKASDNTEENIQARIRAIYLMALSNKFGHLVIATSNKSESAVGYATLYGDMCGAYSLIKDLYKTEIYELCKWRNNYIPNLSQTKIHNPIPDNIIKKAPTAELRANQKDSDNLPEYEILDQILEELIERQNSISAIVKIGFAKDLVEKVYNLLKNSEYKRYQAAIGPKISTLSFDKERRIAITNFFDNA